MTALCHGIHETCIGVPDLAAALRHWEAFGFRLAARGALDRPRALSLYGVDSAVESWRLGHGAADKGLVRLMRWQRPTGAGLSMAPLRTPGNRWTVQKTDDLLSVWTHAAVARRLGREISVLGPVLNARSAIPLARQQPFEAAVPAAYNVQLFQPLYQQVVMQRLHIDARRLGTIDGDSLLRTSEVCHVGLVACNQPLANFDFYETALGLARSTQRRFPYDPDSPASEMFALRPGEAFTEIDFDDPRAIADPAVSLAGRLRVFALESSSGHAPAIDACAGVLGYGLYSLRCTDPSALRESALRAGATAVTPVQSDEFGEPAFCFRSPDGYHWTASAAAPP
jgi:catechol 2,3-dioxygenase-like lactoylglutathione lyase family enzyme